MAFTKIFVKYTLSSLCNKFLLHKLYISFGYKSKETLHLCFDKMRAEASLYSVVVFVTDLDIMNQIQI